jgi:uncharacterized protein YbjT (DUF2867 family)
MILIAGSTGHLGLAVALRLAQAGKRVTGLVRDSASGKAQDLARAGVKLVPGDLKDAASLARATAGVHTVICTASSTLSRRAGDSIETVDRAGVKALIDAAEKAGVSDFVFVSFDHADQATPLARAKREAEARLKASDLNWTILQPSCFCEVWLSPFAGFDVAAARARVCGEGDQPFHYIALADVAQAVVASVGNPAAARKTFRIGGRATTPLEAVRLFEQATGRPFVVERMPLGAIQAGRAAAPDPLTESMFGMLEKMATSGDAVDAGWAEQLGVTVQPLEEWVRAAVAR